MDNNLEQDLNIKNNKYNIKSIFSPKGGIGRLHYFINNIIIIISSLLIITIPFAMIFGLFNVKKRLYDITQDKDISWFLAVVLTFLFPLSRSFIHTEIVLLIYYIVQIIAGAYLLFCKGKNNC